MEARRDPQERQQVDPPPAVARWRRGSAIGAVVTATAAGVRHDVDDTGDDEAVVEEHEAEAGTEQAVELYLVPGVPEASLAVVRPWLLGERR